MIPKDLEGVLVSTPDICDGAIRFRGTRVTVVSLFENIRGGKSLEDFLLTYPGVARYQASAVLEWQEREACRMMGIPSPVR